MFIGAKAQTFDAEKIVGYGKADGLPRNEIDDSGMTLKKPFSELAKEGQRSFRLGQLIDHPELFRAYPGLKRTKVTVAATDDPTQQRRNGYDTNGGNINMGIGPNTNPQAFLKELSHETQHGIQQIEGFHGGASGLGYSDEALTKTSKRLEKRGQKTGNPALLDKRFELVEAAVMLEERRVPNVGGKIELATEQLKRRSERIYQKMPGELEAKFTEENLNLSPLQRSLQMPGHLQTTALTSQAQAREYTSSERAVVRSFARKQAMVIMGESLLRAFNVLGRHPDTHQGTPASMNLKATPHRP